MSRPAPSALAALGVSLVAVLLACGLPWPCLAADSDPLPCSGAHPVAQSDMCTLPSAGAGAGFAAATDTGASLVLLGNPMSTCTRRVILTLLEKDLPGFKLKVVNLQNREQKEAEFMKLQPFGQVPVLQDQSNNLTLFESRAIARYIAEKYEGQGTPLLGTTPEERALVGVWAEVESQEFNPPASILAYEMVIGVRYGREPNKERAEEAAKKLATVLDVYDERLEGREFLAGDHVSLADLSHIPYMAHVITGGYGHLVEDRPNVNAWWQRIIARQSWRRILEGIP